MRKNAWKMKCVSLFFSKRLLQIALILWVIFIHIVFFQTLLQEKNITLKQIITSIVSLFN